MKVGRAKSNCSLVQLGTEDDGEPKKFRYDHVFASKVLRPKSAEYLHEFRTERKLSDHSPLEVVFEF